VELTGHLTPYLPLLLALSTSSPFWRGRNTGLKGYRLAAYDEIPRTGIPEFFASEDDYKAYVAASSAAAQSRTKATSGGCFGPR
jgi:carboxylate-amine ligase